MLSILGDAVEKETITVSFEVLSSVREGIKEIDLAAVMDTADVAYIIKEAPKTGDVYDWVEFTEAMFSR